MPWKLIRIRKSGRKPQNGRQCTVCDCEIDDNDEAWSNRNKHRSKLICKICFPKIWV